MPREQRTNLKKTAVNETERGVFSSKPVGTVDMPVVQPTKSAGQALAEGLGMATKAISVYGQEQVDKKSKIEAITQRSKGITAGRDEATKILTSDEYKKTPLEKRMAFLATAIGNANDNVGKLGSVHASYLDGYLSIIGSTLGAAGDDVVKILKADDFQRTETDLRNALKFDLFSTNKSPLDALKDVKNSKLQLGNKGSGKWFVTNVAALIKERAESDPNFDWQTAIDEKLKITPEKGIVYADHPEYGALIDTLESELETLTKARRTAADKENDAFSDQITKKAIATAADPNSTPEDLAKSRSIIIQNIDKFDVGDFQTALDVIDDRLDITGFSSVSNIESLTILRSGVVSGRFKVDDLKDWKGVLTQGDYLDLHAKALKVSEDIVKGQNQALSNALIDSENNLKRIVAKVDPFTGGFLDEFGEKKMQLASSLWNEFVINYRNENPEAPFPSMEEQNKAALRIENQVKATYPEETLGNTSGNKSTTETNTETVVTQLPEGTIVNPVSNYTEVVKEADKKEVEVVKKVETILTTTAPVTALTSGDVTEGEYKTFMENKQQEALWKKKADEASPTFMDKVLQIFD